MQQIGIKFIPRNAEHSAECARQADTNCTVRVGFVEILNEDIRDLLVTDASAQPVVTIREVQGGGVCLAGASDKEVSQSCTRAYLQSAAGGLSGAGWCPDRWQRWSRG